MQIGSEMATLQEKKPKMDPKKRFFLKNPPFLNFWNQFLNPHIKPIFFGRDINFVLKCLPAQCDQVACALFDDRS